MSVETITSEWLSSVLKAKGVVSSSVDVRSIDKFPEGLSATGTLARINVSYEPGDSGPASIIAKLPDPGKSTPATGSTYRREIRFYEEIGNASGVRVPKMYFGGTNGDAAIMLLEDLSPAEPGDSTVGCSYEEGVAALRGLASLHAKWWNKNDFLAADWLWGRSIQSPSEQVAELIDEGWNLLPADYLSELPPALFAVGNKPGWFADIASGRNEEPQTLSHPDYRLDNLFFAHDFEDVKLTVIDWGRVTAQRPGFAVAFFLADSGLTKREIENCLDAYWRSLTKSGVSDFRFDDCIIEFKRGVLELLGQRLWQFAVGANDGKDSRILTMRKRGWDRVVQLIDEFECLTVVTDSID